MTVVNIKRTQQNRIGYIEEAGAVANRMTAIPIAEWKKVSITLWNLQWQIELSR